MVDHQQPGNLLTRLKEIEVGSEIHTRIDQNLYRLDQCYGKEISFSIVSFQTVHVLLSLFCPCAVLSKGYCFYDFYRISSQLNIKITIMEQRHFK